MQERTDVAGALAAWAAVRAAGHNVELDRFVPQWDRQYQQQTPEQMVAVLRSFQAKRQGGKR